MTGLQDPGRQTVHDRHRHFHQSFHRRMLHPEHERDAARVGGVNENLAILLLAAKFGVRVFPHAGGVGLCELVQHLAMADYVAISGSMEDRAIEFVDHLHEHFLDPVRIREGRYLAPSMPGFSAQMRRETLQQHRFADGSVWNVGEPFGHG
jgi:L-fuconate dehydratase